MAYNFSLAKEGFTKATDWLRNEYNSLHTGRATPIVLDSINIEAYGSYQPIKNVASINIEDARTLRVAPWDKNQIKDIEKSISAANLGLSVATDDQGLRVIFPILTTENRQKLVKVLKDKLEDARITVRKTREDVLNDIKGEGLPEDDVFRAKEELQKIVDDFNRQLESLFDRKENEVMTQ